MYNWSICTFFVRTNQKSEKDQRANLLVKDQLPLLFITCCLIHIYKMLKTSARLEKKIRKCLHWRLNDKTCYEFIQSESMVIQSCIQFSCKFKSEVDTEKIYCLVISILKIHDILKEKEMSMSTFFLLE